MYSGTYPASLNAVDKIYQWAKNQSTTPLYLSEYARRAKSLYETGIAKDLNGNWIISSTGVRSIRLPILLGKPKMNDSDIAGWKKDVDGFYITLNGVRNRLSLYDKQKVNKDKPQVRLNNANAQLLRWQQKGNISHWSFEAHVPLEFEISDAADCVVVSEFSLVEYNTDSNTRGYRTTDTGRISGKLICE